MEKEVLLAMDGPVAVITLNRPQAQNSLNAGLIEGLGDAYRRCDSDDDVRAVVLTGAGRSFCAGADMSAGGDTFDARAMSVEVDSCPLSMQAFEVRKPVIAACNGHAVGAGLGLAMQADMRIFAAGAKYGFLQSRRGVVADFAMEYLLPRLLGLERALELLMRGQLLHGEEAVAWGLASRCASAEQVLDLALEIAADIAANAAPMAVALHKRMLWRSLELPYAELAARESRALNYTMREADAVEGGVAWMEQRPPRWQGRPAADWEAWMDE